jgi:hypothetical protein
MNPFPGWGVATAGGQKMTEIVQVQRRFRVRSPVVEDHHGYVVQEASFEAAAIAYVEDRGARTGEMVVVVHDLETGREHCFRIDLATGAATNCA